MPPKQEKHDPIKIDPLREPGQSLREQLNDVLYDRMLMWFMVGGIMAILTLMEWYGWFFNVERSPVFYTAVTLCICVAAFWKVRRAKKEIEQIRLGIRGERATGQFLQNSLLPKGYWVVHDIPQKGYNIDHAIIGPGGVFAVETKTRSKPRGDVRVEYDGTSVKVDGFEPDRDPVMQAQAAASRLEQILLEYTGKKVPVRSVVLFPGWYVNNQPKGVKTWVMNEKNLVGFIKHEDKKLELEEIHVLAAGLGRYVRDQQKQHS